MAVNLAPLLRQRFFDANGAPLAGGLLYSYVAGTTTPLATYSDSNLTSNADPTVLDANGYADIWIDQTLAYKFVLKDSGGATLWTVDNVSFPLNLAAWNAGPFYQLGNIVQDASGKGLLYVSRTNGNQNNALSSVTNWRAFGGNITSVSGNTNLSINDELVRSDSTSGNITHTLPACSTTAIGKRITVIDVGTGGNTTAIKGSGSDVVGDLNTYGTTLILNQSVTLENTGIKWDALGIMADGAVSTAKLAAGSVTPPKLAAFNGVTSSSSGTFSTASASYVDVTNLSVSITTRGRPVCVLLLSDNSSAANSGTNGAAILIQAVRGSTSLGQYYIGPGGISTVPSILAIDTQSAGTYTYKIQVNNTGAGTVQIQHYVLYVYEIS